MRTFIVMTLRDNKAAKLAAYLNISVSLQN